MSFGWIFDVELFYKIKKNNYSLCHLSIEWEHKEDTNMSVFAPFKMSLDILLLRLKLIKNK